MSGRRCERKSRDCNFDEGLLDSFGTVELLMAIESQLGITVPITEFDRDVWDTPNHIAEQLAEMK